MSAHIKTTVRGKIKKEKSFFSPSDLRKVCGIHSSSSGFKWRRTVERQQKKMSVKATETLQAALYIMHLLSLTFETQTFFAYYFLKSNLKISFHWSVFSHRQTLCTLHKRMDKLHLWMRSVQSHGLMMTWLWLLSFPFRRPFSMCVPPPPSSCPTSSSSPTSSTLRKYNSYYFLNTCQWSLCGCRSIYPPVEGVPAAQTLPSCIIVFNHKSLILSPC